MEDRLAIGLSLDLVANEVRAALVKVTGVGLASKVECTTWSLTSVRTPGGVERASSPVRDEAHGTAPTDALMIARVLLGVARTLLDRASVRLDQLLVLGVVGEVPSESQPDTAMVAARLAELSGVTTVSGLSQRDWAAGGRGKPLNTMVDWIVAHDRERSRVVVHLDAATTLSHLPARSGPAAARALEVGPGVGLLDALASALSAGQRRPDARGMLAVQGRQIKPLIRRWAAHPFLRQAPPKFLLPEDFAGSFIEETVQLAVERGWSMADVLCSATHFVAACPADAVRRVLATDRALEQVAFVGKGTQNGFLLRLLEEQFAGVGLVSLPPFKLATEAYEAVTAGMMACLTLDSVESNLPTVTGAAGPRLLGQLTPGSTQNWRRCVEWMHRATAQTSARAA